MLQSHAVTLKSAKKLKTTAKVSGAFEQSLNLVQLAIQLWERRPEDTHPKEAGCSQSAVS